MDDALRVLAFYLPQYHPIAENDEWWGAGFTEWTQVAKAKPLYRGHVQPRLPANLGFYDLRLPEVRQAQAELAHRAGVTGFIYWHYWFGNGKRLLERPFQEVSKSGEPNFPFALAWANESWSRRWYGDSRTILAEQTYPGASDYRDHFFDILPALSDDRYIKVDGKPVFFVYRPQDLPNQREFVDTFNSLAEHVGFPGMYIIAGEGLGDPRPSGFDAAYAQPKLLSRRTVTNSARSTAVAVTRRVLDKGGPLRIPYEVVMSDFYMRPTTEWIEHIAVMPNWDNTPRRDRGGIVLTGTGPEVFEPHVAAASKYTQKMPGQRRLLFLKSWNEWAEGNYVEPDSEHGEGWLNSLAKGIGR